MPLRYRGSHRPAGAYMGTRWRTRSGVPERRVGEPRPRSRRAARSSTSTRALRIGTITLVCCWRARRPQRAVSLVGCRSEYLRIVPRAHLRPRAPGATDHQRQPGARVDPEGCLVAVDPRTTPPTVGFWLSRGAPVRHRCCRFGTSGTRRPGSGHAGAGDRVAPRIACPLQR